MRPAKTEQSNVVYRGPTAEIGDLWCQRVQPGEIRSIWALSDDERQLIAAGGVIELAIFGEPTPPVSLNVTSAADARITGPNPYRVIPELDDEERQGG